MKNQIRSYIKQLSRSQDPHDLSAWSQIIMEKVEMLDAFRVSQTIALYWSLPLEVDTHRWVNRWSGNKRVLLPVMKGKNLLLRRYSGVGDLKEACFGVFEPQNGEVYGINSVDMIVVPGVAFDCLGARMGYGKGYYDRLLQGVGNRPCKVAVCFDYQMVEQVPTDVHDVMMDVVVSEKKTIFVR